jgi:predicted ATPase
MSAQIRRAWEALLMAEARAAPLVLVLEDLQWGDLPSVKLVDAALWVLAEQPLLVLAVARPEVHELFPKLWAERELQEERLGALSRKGGERLVREVLGDRVTPERARDLAARSGGNAFYLEELIRSVAEGRGEELPETVLAMASARLEGLDPAARRVLRAASVFGQVFWSGAVRALLGSEMVTSDLGDWLSLLDDEEVVSARISSRFEGETEWTFRHALVRQAAYSTLTERDRTVGHRLAADWLVTAGETDAMVLAEHFERGAARDRAAIWYGRAAEHALEGQDLEAAMDRASRGLSCLPAPHQPRDRETTELRGALRLVQTRVIRWRGHRGEQLETALSALADLRPGGRRWYQALSEAVFVVGASGELEELRGFHQRLGEASPDADAGAARTMALARTAVQLLMLGARDEARAALSRLPELAEVDDEPMVAALVARARSWWALYDGDFAAHLELLLAAMRQFERAGDLHTAAAASANVGYAFMLLGAYGEAEEQLSRTIERCRELGSHTTSLHALHNLGLVRALRGDLAAALRTEQEAVAGYRAIGNDFMEGACETYCAIIELYAGRAEAAGEAAQRATALIVGHPANRAMAQAVLAQSLLLRAAERADDAVAAAWRAEALAAATEAVGLLDGASVSGEESALCRLALAQALHATGDIESARAAIAAAARRVHEQAAKIADPSRRASFLAVPEHARTLELQRTWSEAGGPSMR